MFLPFRLYLVCCIIISLSVCVCVCVCDMTKIGTDMGFTLFLKAKDLTTVSKYVLSKYESLKQPIPNPRNVFALRFSCLSVIQKLL